MLDIPEHRRHWVAQLVSGNRDECVTRVHRLRQLRDQTRVRAPRREVGVGDPAARLAKLAGQFGFAFHHDVLKSPFRLPELDGDAEGRHREHAAALHPRGRRGPRDLTLILTANPFVDSRARPGDQRD